uniref:NADH-ubiquinone oxidoreductase chain 2 n=2 Tax=Acoptolabrus TaxID=49287 RepID=A0A6C0NA16_9CARA|nr:NADH dehydrogenase subunit 2 [Carabus mirabilissimus mirabilissimus]YP_009737799.1 NADH dehydrogenase subunit 2 [Carabus changeonleei]ACT36231.1 NADH dehydrogenase subunit 2 [Carabus mirabilissimus mirabilissimus]QHW07534.1 NADH dehydrogenase subunit 2 [Carabus changeonleei]
MTNLYKLIFLMTLMMGTMISVSSYTWLGTWMGLEINLLSFIPLLKKKNDPFSTESSIKYFLVQTLASTMFLFSMMLIMMMKNMISDLMNINQFMTMMINTALLLKMGVAPFHFWLPEIIEGMNWINSLILMTWQKIAPMMLLSYTLKSSNYIIFIIMMSTMIGSIGGLNQTSMRKIMAYSSINHLGWMISSFLNNEMIWMIYFSIYSFISMTFVLMMNMFNIYYLKQIFSFMNKNLLVKFMMLMNMLSLGGLPPFLGFLPKWMIIQYLSNNYMYLTFFMIMMTLITLFFYLRITYTSLILIHNELNFNFMMNFNTKNNFFMLFLSFISVSGLILCTLIFNFY